LTQSPAAQPRYTAGIYDLCTKTNLASLTLLELTVKSTRREAPYNGKGQACVFELTTPTGHPATLRVEAAVADNDTQAEQIYRAQRTGRMQFEGAVAGIGQIAEAFTLESEPGVKYSEYKIHARDANFVLEVWLTVGGTTFAPTSHTGGIVRHVSDNTYKDLCLAWQTPDGSAPPLSPSR